MANKSIIVCDANKGGIFGYANPLHKKLSKNIKIEFFYPKESENKAVFYLKLV
jgi:hypothetical protein